MERNIPFYPSLRTTKTMLALTMLVHRSEAEMHVVWQFRANAPTRKNLYFSTAYGGDYRVAMLLVMTEKKHFVTNLMGSNFAVFQIVMPLFITGTLANVLNSRYRFGAR